MKREPDEPVRKFIDLSESFKQEKSKSVLTFGLAMFVNGGMSLWSLLIILLVEGNCDRPLRNILLGCCIVFATAFALCLCSYLLIGGLADSLSDQKGSIDPFYQPVSQQDQTVPRHDEESGSVIVEEAGTPQNIRPITDRITCTYCTITYLICSFASLLSLMATSISWVLVEKNNCSTAAPDLYNHSKYFLIGLLVFSVLQVMWYVVTCRLCSVLVDVYAIQQRFTTWHSAQRYHPKT